LTCDFSRGHRVICCSGEAFFANACNPIVKQRWYRAFLDVYNDFLVSLLMRDAPSTGISSENAPDTTAHPPLWLATIPLPVLYIAYAILVEKGVPVTDEALLQVVMQPDALFRGYQDVQISAMREHEYGMTRGAAAAAYAHVFEKMAEAGSLDFMLKAESAAVAEDDDDDDCDREVAWWCIPPDSDVSKGKDALAELVGGSHL
jgi:hypothetical protein